ncbi:MAG: radical SAM family heme chaperone HemW [Flavobacteriales bacterium]|nr:radical SAM family heme chaperone HemW [Flavobacteriales bacterium]MDG1779477.1 radical SAM family heme chaperone HemW [Flavobacteriales bacterium]
MAGIYLHIPYCKQACHYCDFHFSTVLNSREDMVGSMLQEIEQRADELKGQTVTTIYFGGGTPSILSTQHLDELLVKMRRSFTLAEAVEVTLEANPDDLNSTQLNDWKDIGINRLSIGLQSFHDSDLKWMNRAHNQVEALNAVWAARDAGFHNLTIDLIYGLPTWKGNEWEQNLLELGKLDVPHFSAYILTVEDKTALGASVAKGKEKIVSDVRIEQQYEQLTAFAKANGYNHYEVSNFSKPGHSSQHNSNYWNRVAYIGIGPGAHSFDGSKRAWNIANNPRYIKAIKDGSPFSEEENLSRFDQYNEYIMTRLRTASGIDLVGCKSLFGLRPDEVEPLLWKDLVKEGKLEMVNDRYRVTEKAWLVSDRIASDLFAI